MLQSKIIRRSVNQWNAPLLVVPKKKADASGKPKLRVVVDFRKLNNITIGDFFHCLISQRYWTSWERQIFYNVRFGVGISPNPDGRAK